MEILPPIGLDQPWFTVVLLAARWVMSKKFLYGEIESGRLKAHRFGRAYRISLADARAYEDAHFIQMAVT